MPFFGLIVMPKAICSGTCNTSSKFIVVTASSLIHTHTHTHTHAGVLLKHRHTHILCTCVRCTHTHTQCHVYIHTCIHPYLSLGGSHKGVTLKHLNESYFCLQQSQPHPDTVTRTKSKRHVGKLRSLGPLLWCEPKHKKWMHCLHLRITFKPVRIKLFRVLPINWAMVDDTNRYNNNNSFWDSNSIDNSSLIAVSISSIRINIF